jgi:hypothetical protein
VVGGVRASLLFEVVYTCPEWYDGPRCGIADYQGEPHLFLSEWADGKDMDAVTFLLSPVTPDVFRLAIEDWAIWRRWETAYCKGQADQNTHPALPHERARHEELQALLNGRLEVDQAWAIRKHAEFRVRADPAWSGFGFRPLEVRWLDPA